MEFWAFLAWMFWAYVFFACIWIFISIVIDIFRDHTLGGGAKALWLIFLVFLPFLGALIYLIARGRSMSERGAAEASKVQQANNDYIRSVAGASSPAAEIDKAQQLLANGTITQAEFDALKAKALA